MKTGDIVRVERLDGKSYDCFVIEDYSSRDLFYGRVLSSSKDKVATASWERFGLNQNGVCQMKTECESIKVLSPGEVITLEDLNSTKIFRNTNPDTGESLTFCISEGAGGWSTCKDESIALYESYVSSRNHLQEVQHAV